MNCVRKACHGCALEFRRWRKDYRILVVFLLLFLILLQNTKPYFDFSTQMNYPSSPWYFPFLMSGSSVRLEIYLIAVLYFSNVFSPHPVQRYQFIRMGRYAYLLGKIFYIAISAAIFTIAILLFSILPHLNQIYFEADWGKLLQTLAYRLQGVGYFSVSSYVLENYQAVTGTLLSVLLTFLSLFFLGLVMYFANALIGRGSGNLLGGFLTCLDYMINFMSAGNMFLWIFPLSPLSWANLCELTGRSVRLYSGPSLFYALFMYVLMALLLIAASFFLTRISARSGSKRTVFRLFDE